MKWFFFLCFLCLVVISTAWWQTMQLSSSVDHIDINTTVDLQVRVDWISNPWPVTIQGLEPFTVRGQATSTSMQINNGQQSAQLILQLQLQPTMTGMFTLGPARLETASGSIESNSIRLEVTGEKVFLQPQPLSAIMPVQEQQQANEELSSVSNGAVWWTWLLWAIGIGCVLLWRAWRRYHHEDRDTTHTVDIKKDTSHTYTSLLMLPPDSPDFRTQIEYGWRTLLADQVQDSCVLTAGYEEIVKSYSSLDPMMRDIYMKAFDRIREARYAWVDAWREEMIALWKKVITIHP